MISTFFAVLFFVNLNTANAQVGEMASNNTLTGKEHLPYTMIPEFHVWKEIAGLSETSEKTIDINAAYNKTNKQITVDGTDNGGDVEVWDVNGNTIFDKASDKPNTIFKAGNLRKGAYYIHYNNGSKSEGIKLSIR
jgi:hypothetical protein